MISMINTLHFCKFFEMWLLLFLFRVIQDSQKNKKRKWLMVKLRQKNQEFVLTFIASYILLKLKGLNIMQAGVSSPFCNLTDEEIGPKEKK